jgi:hypothetical protein
VTHDRCAISVPLASVNGGQPRSFVGTRMPSSAVWPAVTGQIPKLIVRVRFPSPAQIADIPAQAAYRP